MKTKFFFEIAIHIFWRTPLVFFFVDQIFHNSLIETFFLSSIIRPKPIIFFSSSIIPLKYHHFFLFVDQIFHNSSHRDYSFIFHNSSQTHLFFFIIHNSFQIPSFFLLTKSSIIRLTEIIFLSSIIRPKPIFFFIIHNFFEIPSFFLFVEQIFHNSSHRDYFFIFHNLF